MIVSGSLLCSVSGACFVVPGEDIGISLRDDASWRGVARPCSSEVWAGRAVPGKRAAALGMVDRGQETPCPLLEPVGGLPGPSIGGHEPHGGLPGLSIGGHEPHGGLPGPSIALIGLSRGFIGLSIALIGVSRGLIGLSIALTCKRRDLIGEERGHVLLCRGLVCEERGFRCNARGFIGVDGGLICEEREVGSECRALMSVARGFISVCRALVSDAREVSGDLAGVRGIAREHGAGWLPCPAAAGPPRRGFDMAVALAYRVGLMSLPIAGGPKGPNRAPTHKPLNLDKMMNLGLAVEEAADGEPITGEAMDELALEQGVDASHLYAAAATTTDVAFAREHDVAFIACGGVCQNWGALARLEQLVTLRQQRLDAGQKGFDIQARRCLDRCDHAPVIQIQTSDGTAWLTDATEAAVAEAVAQACD